MATKNITYILGAGASYNSLQIVNDIPKALDDFANRFNPGEKYHTLAPIELWDNVNIAKSALYQLNHDIENQKECFLKLREFHNDILWLKSHSEIHTSIDTFAKKLYLKKDNENLKKLKTILSCFFLFLQTEKFDSRYDSFFASILDDLSNLPHNLKILSWNYDSQLEIGFSNFTDEKVYRSKKQLNLHSRGDVMFDAYEPNEFCVYKINGTTNIKKGEFGVDEIISDFDSNNLHLVESFLNTYMQSKNSKSQPSMTFAWEDFNLKKGFFPNLTHSISETDILIVIGYSFPFFNRKVDSTILGGMPKLSKVYVQDPKFASEIIDKIKQLTPNYNETAVTKDSLNIDFEPITFVDQFFIPIEF